MQKYIDYTIVNTIHLISIHKNEEFVTLMLHCDIFACRVLQWDRFIVINGVR